MKKKVSLVCLTLVLSACGMSEKEKEQQAIITCNVIEATKRMDVASTIKEINAARETMGEPLFIDDADTVETAVFFGKCEDLVANKSNWKENLEGDLIALFASLLEVDLIDYQELKKSVPESLLSAFYSSEFGKKRENNYQALKDYINGGSGERMAELTKTAIKSCSGPDAILNYIKELGECPSE